MPSPPAEQIQSSAKARVRRASSLPPEKTNLRISPPASPKTIRSAAVPGSPVATYAAAETAKKGMVEIEELSPEAIIPDSVSILRDPEIEIPDDEGSTESELEKRFWGIKLDRMRDDGDSEDSDKVERKKTPLPISRTFGQKRKFAHSVEDEVIEPARKRTTSPGTLSPSRSNDPG